MFMLLFLSCIRSCFISLKLICIINFGIVPTDLTPGQKALNSDNSSSHDDGTSWFAVSNHVTNVIFAQSDINAVEAGRSRHRS